MGNKIIKKGKTVGGETLLVEHSNPNFGDGVTHINYYVGVKKNILSSIEHKFDEAVKEYESGPKTVAALLEEIPEYVAIMETDDLHERDEMRKKLSKDLDNLSLAYVSYRGNDLSFMNPDLNYVGGGFYTKAIGVDEAKACAERALTILKRLVAGR